MNTIYVDKDFKFSGDFDQEIAATVGFFDGVHRGHRFLISQLKDIALRSGLPSAVVTFPVHPRKILQSDYQPELLNNFEEKLFQLSSTGVDYCFVVDFTKELSELTAEQFIQEKLRKELKIKKLIVGYDHRFGKGRTDDFEDYKVYGKACGMDVFRAKQLKEEYIHISSTTIRKLLKEGKMRGAAEILSYNYTLEGVVIAGNQMGRKMGFPTANLRITEAYKVIPSEGIYATKVYFEDQVYKGMTYIGNRPTLFSEGEKRIEVHLIDFSGNLYNKNLKIEFVDYIRDDMQFDSMESLEKQLHQDKTEIIRILN